MTRASAYSGHIGVVLGGKFLDESDWDPVQTQAEFGFITTWGKKEWPVHIATDLFLSIEDDNPSVVHSMGAVPVVSSYNVGAPSGETWELGLGARKI